MEDNTGYKLHAQAAIGYNFKSELFIYNAGISDGEITTKGYIDQILNRAVLPQCVNRGNKDFVLEEDSDLGHGYGGGTNKVDEQKAKHGLKTY